jgi:5-methylcytosine-specific restriction endonuclease McrA
LSTKEWIRYNLSVDITQRHTGEKMLKNITDRRAYYRAYYQQRKDDPEFIARKRANDLRYHRGETQSHYKADRGWRSALQEKVKAYKLNKGCAYCGFKGHSAALHFHHRDPTAKLFILGGHMGNRSPEEVWAEIAKCEIVCANCHAMIHAGALAPKA